MVIAGNQWKGEVPMANLWETPSGERIHIGFLGMTNAGKSTWMNALTGKNMSLVSPVAGTTTDPVEKAMELLPLGPVLLIDTAGFGDDSVLGEAREEKMQKVLAQLHFAIIVVSNAQPFHSRNLTYLALLQERKIPYLVLVNDFGTGELPPNFPPNVNYFLLNPLVSADVETLKKNMIAQFPQVQEPSLTGDLVKKGDKVLLVVPQDVQAPKGRLILPQVQVIRDLLDQEVMVSMVKLEQLSPYLTEMPLPDLVIVDSQIFAKVNPVLPPQVRLTSFSILMAKYKGDIATWIAGAKAIAALQPGDKIMIWEACTHHVQEGDIARQKLPRLLEKIVGGPLEITCYSGKEFPDNIRDYKLIIHCGGCMLNPPQVKYRLEMAQAIGIPITNFGIVFAYGSGMLDRVCY